MAGGYTHVTLVQLAIEEAVHRKSAVLHDEAAQALQLWKKYAIIGSMGPDYPYLDVTDTSSAAWAAAMHSRHVLDFVREAARRIRILPDKNIRQKCTAWLFGFASHCVADGTVHPVVNRKVGPYEQNKTEHRRCEMSQDVLVHAQLNLGAIELNGQISFNVAETSDGSSRLRIDRDIAVLWRGALNVVWRGGRTDNPFSLSGAIDRLKQWTGSPPAEGLPAPDPDQWHRAMWRMLKLAESGGQLIPFARHAAANAGVTYPAKPELHYVRNLEVPGNRRMDFEQIFVHAKQNTVAFWGNLSLFLQGKPSPLDNMEGWGLDDGIDHNEHYVFWS
ncbi:zinc dependent phospholipase C family protein [Desulfobulbus sp. F5]|nr:zinc dependent phospholipase C family protein [Desulfobulbus sp. F5]